MNKNKVFLLTFFLLMVWSNFASQNWPQDWPQGHNYEQLFSIEKSAMQKLTALEKYAMQELTAQQSYWQSFKRDWQSFKRGIRSILSYSATLLSPYLRNIARPVCIAQYPIQDYVIFGEKPYSIYKYQLSHDTDEVKRLRKALKISGIYFDDCLYSTHNKVFQYREPYPTCAIHDKVLKYLKDHPLLISPEYRENGFDKPENNSIMQCLTRLIRAMSHAKPISKAHIQLLWELEDALQKEFNLNKNTDPRFFRLIGFEMLDLPKNQLLSEIIETDSFLTYAKQIINYLLLWKNNSYLFSHNKSLNVALEELFLIAEISIRRLDIEKKLDARAHGNERK